MRRKLNKNLKKVKKNRMFPNRSRRESENPKVKKMTRNFG